MEKKSKIYLASFTIVAAILFGAVSQTTNANSNNVNSLISSLSGSTDGTPTNIPTLESSEDQMKKSNADTSNQTLNAKKGANIVSVSPFSLSLSSTQSAYTLGDKVSLSGTVTSSSIKATNQISTVGAKNIGVIIEAFQGSNGNNTIFGVQLKTDENGAFSTSFYPPNDGTVKVFARLISIGNTTEEVPSQTISIVINKSLIPSIAIIAIIIGAFASLLLIPRFFPRSEVYSIIITAIVIGIGYIILYRYPPLDSAGNIALATALFVPIAAYLIDLVRKDREDRETLEASVSKYRDEHLTKEVESLIKIHQEITQHQSVFMTKIDLGIELSTTAYKDASLIKVGTIANLPGLRIDRYYYFVELYNELLREGLYLKINHYAWYTRFRVLFTELKDLYSSLNEIVYVNLIYNEGEIHRKFLSFPSVNFPPRLSGPLLNRLVHLQIISKSDYLNIKDSFYDRIYKQEYAFELMELLNKDFKNLYKDLERKIGEIQRFFDEIKRHR